MNDCYHEIIVTSLIISVFCCFYGFKRLFLKMLPQVTLTQQMGQQPQNNSRWECLLVVGRGSWVPSRGSWVPSRGSWVPSRGSWVPSRGSWVPSRGLWVIDWKVPALA